MPLLETLVTEMRKATDRNLPFNFSHYIMICKLFKTKSESAQDHQVMNKLQTFENLFQLPSYAFIAMVIYKVGRTFAL